jgi:hypothetical protein
LDVNVHLSDDEKGDFQPCTALSFEAAATDRCGVTREIGR